MRKLTTVVVSLLLLTSLAIGQDYTWEFDGLLYDFQLPQTHGWGVHGVAVAPDGNIWMALHGGLHDEVIETAAGDTIGFYRPLYIVDPNGNHVSFSPLKVLEFSDGTLDTMHTNSPINGSGKGISVDNDGNILYTSWSTVYRINYQTGMAMNVFTPDDMSSMTEAVQDENGNIYVGYVLSASRPVYILDNDFNLIGNAVDTLGHINRTIAISPDGKDLYVGSTWNGFGVTKWHSDIPGVTAFEAVDTLGNWESVYDPVKDTTYTDVKLWASCLDWDPDGNLLAGNLRDDWSGPGGKGSQYYAFDVTTGEIVYEVGKPFPHDSTDGGLYSPRGAAWSADGETMYLSDFDYNIVGRWVKTPVGVAVVKNNRPITFNLKQNYPNPFNPSTTIVFSMSERGFVELKVYDIQGREVKALVSESMEQGTHKIHFDATGMTSGVYYYTLTHNGHKQTKQMVLVK